MPNLEYQRARRSIKAAWRSRPQGLTGRLLRSYLLAATWSEDVRARYRIKVVNELMREAG